MSKLKMAIQIKNNVENKLLGRKEIFAVMNNDGGTPKRAEVRKALAKQLKVDEKLVVVNKVTSYYGNTELNVKAKVYDNEKSLNTNARPHMRKRNAVVEEVVEETEEAAPAPAAEEKAEEVPAEEPATEEEKKDE